MSLLRSFFVLSTLLTVPSLAADLSRTTIPGKWIEPLLPEDAPALKHPGYFGELDKARAEAFGGRYRKALSMLRQIKDADPVEVALVRGPALAALGRVDEAVATLSDPDVIDEPRVQIGRATVLADAGKTSDALALVKTHLVKHPDSIAGRYCLGALSERTGDLDAARAAYVWFVDEPQRFLDKWQGSREKGFDDAEQVTLIGRAIDRWAILTGQYPNNPALHNTILNLFVRAYDVIDRSYWPAHVAAAEFYIAHDNAQAALMELAQAQEANPRDRRALELVGLLALDLHKFDAAEQTIATLRDVDANSLTADLLEARSLLLQRRTRAADVVLRRVLAAHPDNIDALTLSATLALLRTRDVDAAGIFSRIDRLVPDNATPYHDAADVLTSLWQYHRAEDLYQIATERAPWWNAPRNGLGLLYTQNGEEDQARAVLDAAHAVDPFNLKTTNYLRILDRMAQFKRHETEHFVFLYDPIDDPVVPEYFAPYMEEA
ncbi:MAG: tetratricopeptide repeat protein, partial [Tepidisphaeraceae bacterium]